ncbi:MAG: formylglycine-generating enzyme family protein [Akkermansiaceae bacterium]
MKEESSEHKPCCLPKAEAGQPHDDHRGRELIAQTSSSGLGEMVSIPEGDFLMGGDGPETWKDDREGPVREIHVDAFEIGIGAVTNREFAEFVSETGYKTDAEHHGWSFVFFQQIPEHRLKNEKFGRVKNAEWWFKVEGACWKAPAGSGTDIKNLLDHPVTQVSWNDAQAYCQWAGARLPSEAEWECAARGGLEQKLYPWGDDLTTGGKHHCNIWQGDFPIENTGEDGFKFTAPVRSFQPNGYGLYNTSGNVWEWCEDLFAPHDLGFAERVVRGGSFLCHDSYCNRYRNSARTSSTAKTSMSHTGFRCARSY